MAAFYNEIDPHAAQWLRNLIAAGLIAPGVVDERSIEDIKPEELRGFTQCHFFAGVGVWSYALRLAGWPDDRPVWTGSCPCQPFSVAGKGLGTDDERHLWPHLRRLIADGKPARVIGEQVASKDGRLWLAGVRADLETLGYGVGAADLCAAGIGAPHIRQRLYWVADSECGGLQGGAIAAPKQNSEQFTGGREISWGNNWVHCTDGKARRIEPGIVSLVNGFPGRVGLVRGYGNAIVPQLAAAFVASYMEVLA